MLLATSLAARLQEHQKALRKSSLNWNPHPGRLLRLSIHLGGDNWLRAHRNQNVRNNRQHRTASGGGITASSQWEAGIRDLDKVGPIMAALEEANQCSGNSIPS